MKQGFKGEHKRNYRNSTCGRRAVSVEDMAPSVVLVRSSSIRLAPFLVWSVAFYPWVSGSPGVARYADSPRPIGADCRRLLASDGICRSRRARKGGVSKSGCHSLLYFIFVFLYSTLCIRAAKGAI